MFPGVNKQGQKKTIDHGNAAKQKQQSTNLCK